MHVRPPHLIQKNIKLTFHDSNCLHDVNNLNNDTCTTYIEMVTSYKYLGVYVDNHFKWNVHVEKLQKKLQKCAFMIYHLGNCATYNVLRQAYFSMVESYIRHGIAAWGSATHCRLLQSTQNRILRILKRNHLRSLNNHNSYIHNVNNYLSSNTSNHSDFNIAKDQRVLNVKSIYHTTLAIEFYDDPRFRKPIDHHHNTRSRTEGRFKVERHYNNYGKFSLDVALPNIFNKLPSSLINITNIKKRKKLLKSYFLNSQ